MKSRILSAAVLFLFVAGGAALAQEDPFVKRMKEVEKTAKQPVKANPTVTKKLKVVEYRANTSSARKQDSTGKNDTKQTIKAHPPVTKKLKVVEYNAKKASN